ncbi:uncharacterized protein LOC142823796 isoform X2 [Pelodiscus sinensis]|uniref:uncharacterized protein LOC142823796 isoform X2 n=1 Tax=Pelodiscus sinensis TaxID=13735 RepID=UPI003F6C7202
MLMYPPGIVRRGPHSFPECISDFAFAGWIPVIGELQKLLGKGEYEPLRPSPLFESNFLQVTKRGEPVDVHNRPVLVTLGIAATSPALLLPDVMIIARPIERPQGEPPRRKGAKALVELEMTRLIPLELVSLYLHDMGEQQLKMRLATGRVYYLKLCAPRGEERPLFARWLRLIYLLRAPPDSWASIPSWHARDLRGRSTRLPPSQRLRPIREEEEPGATTPQSREHPASRTNRQHPSTRSVGQQVSSFITPVKRSRSTTNLSDDPSRSRAEVANPWSQKPSAERNQGQLSLAIPSGAQGGTSSRSQVGSWSQHGSCAGSRTAFAPGSPERSRFSVGVGRSVVETASVGVGRSAVETASVGVGRSLLTTNSAAASPSRPASPRFSGMGRDMEPSEKSRERSVERSHANPGHANPGHANPSTEQGRSRSQSQRGSTAASRASVPASSPERSRASVGVGRSAVETTSVGVGRSVPTTRSEAVGPSRPASPRFSGMGREMEPGEKSRERSVERSQAQLSHANPGHANPSTDQGRSRSQSQRGSTAASRASVPAGSPERSRASVGVGRSAVETVSVGVGRSLLTTNSAAASPSRPASPRFSGMGRDMEPSEKSRERSVERSHANPGHANPGHANPSTEQGRSRSQSQRGSTAASRASVPASSPERSRASVGVGRSAVETTSVGVGRSVPTTRSEAVGPSRPASPRFSGMGREMEPGEKSRERSVERSQAQLSHANPGHANPSTEQGRSRSQSQRGSTAASRASVPAGSPERSRASMGVGHSAVETVSVGVGRSVPTTRSEAVGPSRVTSTRPSGIVGDMEPGEKSRERNVERSQAQLGHASPSTGQGRTRSQSPHGSTVAPQQSRATTGLSFHARSGGSRAPSFPAPAAVSPERSQLSRGVGPSAVAPAMGPSGQRSQGSSPVAPPGRQATRSRGPASEGSKFRARFSSSSGSHKRSPREKGSESKGKLKSVLSSAKNRSSLTFMTLYSALSDSLDKLTGGRLSQRKSQEEAEVQLGAKSSKRVTISGVVEMSTLDTPELSSTAASEVGSSKKSRESSVERSHGQSGHASPSTEQGRSRSRSPTGTPSQMGSSTMPRDSGTSRPSERSRISVAAGPSERSRISVAAGPSERSRISVAAGPSNVASVSLAGGPAELGGDQLSLVGRGTREHSKAESRSGGPFSSPGSVRQTGTSGAVASLGIKSDNVSREKSEKYRASVGGSSPERSRMSVPPSSQERSRASVPPESAERSRVSVPPESAERSRVSVPPESAERSRVSVPPESAGRSRVSVPPESAERSRVSVPPESAGRSRASVPPGSAERSRVSVPPESAGRSRVSVPPGSAERSRVSVPPESAGRSRVSVPPESAGRSRVSVPPESAGRSRVSVPPESAERSRVSVAVGPSELSRASVAVGPSEMATVSVAMGLSKPGSLSSARTPGTYAPRSPGTGRSGSRARLGVEAGDVSLGRCREHSQSQAREEGGARSRSPLNQPSLAPNARAASSSRPTELDKQGEGSSRTSKAKSRSKRWQEDKQDPSAGHLASRLDAARAGKEVSSPG